MVHRAATFATALLVAGCSITDRDRPAGPDAAAHDGATPPSERCPSPAAQLAVPVGFCATVYAEDVGRPRQLTVTPGGTVIAAIANSRDGLEQGHVRLLRDRDGDGRADHQAMLGDRGGTGVAWHDGVLYFAQDDRIVRWAVPPGSLAFDGPMQVTVNGLPASGDHPAKAIQIASDGTLLVAIGSETNACQDVNRTAGSPGLDPCPELPARAGLWSFPRLAVGQVFADGRRLATGVRNPTAFAVHPRSGAIYAAVNGRDQLHEHWPALYSAEDDEVLPSEELVTLSQGTDRGWPYCYHDPRDDEMKLAPEYGGDGAIQGRCATIPPPMLALPAHWAPLSIAFGTSTKFPASYQGGMFVAFHGSRFDPLTPSDAVPGYEISYVSTLGGVAKARTPFITGFAGAGRPLPDAALHRPVGVAFGPDGAMYISDDKGGKIWRVTYVGADR